MDAFAHGEQDQGRSHQHGGEEAPREPVLKSGEGRHFRHIHYFLSPVRI